MPGVVTDIFVGITQCSLVHNFLFLALGIIGALLLIWLSLPPFPGAMPRPLPIGTVDAWFVALNSS